MTSSPPPAVTVATTSTTQQKERKEGPIIPPPEIHEFLSFIKPKESSSKRKDSSVANEKQWYHSLSSSSSSLSSPSSSNTKDLIQGVSNEVLQASVSFCQKELHTRLHRDTITVLVRLATLWIHRGTCTSTNGNGEGQGNENGNGNHNGNSFGTAYSQQAGKILQQITQLLLSKLKTNSQQQQQQQQSRPMDGDNSMMETDLILNTRWFLHLLLFVMEPIAGLNTVCATIWRGIGDLSTALRSREASAASASASTSAGMCTSTSTSSKENKSQQEQDINMNQDMDETKDMDKDKCEDEDELFCKQAMDRIYILIGEGFQAALGGHEYGNDDIINGHNPNPNPQQQAQAAKMGKLLKFFLLRLLQLIPLLNQNPVDQQTKTNQSASTPKHSHKHTNKRNYPVSLDMSHHLSVMMHFRGIVLLNQDRLGEDSVKQLGSKIDACIQKLLIHGTPVPVPVHVPAPFHIGAVDVDDTTNSFLVHDPFIYWKLLQLCGNEEGAVPVPVPSRVRGPLGEGSRRKSYFWMGKLYTLIELLDQIHIKMDQAGKATISASSSVSNKEWEVITSLCEVVMCQVVPMCYPLIPTIDSSSIGLGPFSIVANALKAIGNVLILLERTSTLNKSNDGGTNFTNMSANKASRKILHRLMVRWLDSHSSGQRINNRNGPRQRQVKGSHMHPLASQMVVAVLQIHIVRSFLRDRTHAVEEDVQKSEVESASSTKVDFSFKSDGLLRIMSKILFDRRTGSTLRRNIGVVLYRLLQMPDPVLTSLKMRVEAILVSSYVDFLCHIKDSRASLKRKRDSSESSGIRVQWTNIMGLNDVGPILDLLSCSKQFWSKVSSSKREELLEDYSRLFLVGCDRNEMKKKRSSQLFERAPGLTYVSASILEGAIFMTHIQHSQREEVRRQIFKVSMPEDHVRASDLGLFRLARRCILGSKMSSQDLVQHLMRVISVLSRQKAPMKNQFGAAILLAVSAAVLSSDSLPTIAPVRFMIFYVRQLLLMHYSDLKLDSLRHCPDGIVKLHLFTQFERIKYNR